MRRDRLVDLDGKREGRREIYGATAIGTLSLDARFGTIVVERGPSRKPQQQVVTCTIGTMANGATVTVTLVIKPTKKGSFTNVATVTAASPNDPVSGNNMSSVTTLVGP